MNDILKYIMTLSNNHKTQELLIETIGKILSKQDNLFEFIKDNGEKIIHIRDWIHSVVENNEQWKDLRVLTLEALNNTANKYFEKKINKIQTIKLNEIEEKLIEDLEEYYIVQMLTPEALDNESKQMQHCIGHGGYDKKLDNENYLYLSLRDRHNKAHVTLEIVNNEIMQLQGKQNKIPEIKYLERLFPWLQQNKYKNIPWGKIRKYYEDGKWLDFKDIKVEENIDFVKIDSIDNIDIIKIISDKYYLLDKEDEAVYITENNEICYKRNTKRILYEEICKNAKRCKKFVKIVGDNKIDFEYNNINYIYNEFDKKVYSIHKMPENFKINGCLSLINSKIKKLPENLEINGNLFLSDCNNLTKLPENLIINGSLTMKNIYNIKELILKEVKGELNLFNTSVEYISDNIIIEKDLSINHSILKKIPENLTVKGLISLRECGYIQRIPSSVKVDGCFILRNMKNLQKIEVSKFNGDVFIRNCNNIEFEKNIFVDGMLEIENSTINIMSEKIETNDMFYLVNSKLLSSWKDSKIVSKNSFVIEGSNFIDLPKDISCLKIFMDKEHIELLDEDLTFPAMEVDGLSYKMF